MGKWTVDNVWLGQVYICQMGQLGEHSTKWANECDQMLYLPLATEHKEPGICPI